MSNQLTKSNPGSIIEQNQTNVHETPVTWWFFIVKRCRKSPNNKGKQIPLAKSERPMLKNIKTNPNPNPSFGSIRQGSTLKNLVILRSNFCMILTDSPWLRLQKTFARLSILHFFHLWDFHPIFAFHFLLVLADKATKMFIYILSCLALQTETIVKKKHNLSYQKWKMNLPKFVMSQA